MVRPKDLRLPFSWSERKSVIVDSVWFALSREHDFVFPGWEALFENTHPVCVEYCSGNGDWIAEKSLQAPEKNWVACEKRLDRVKKIWAKRKNLGIKNLLIIWGEAFFVTHTFFPNSSISDVFINFPDPWPKRRHANNRIVRPEFVHELARCMQPTSHLCLVTDDTLYSERMAKDVLANERFSSLFDPPYYKKAAQEYGNSFFNALFRSQEKEIRQLLFIAN
jgi:tRNA (guanine-N7-)-methyltransferase